MVKKKRHDKPRGEKRDDVERKRDERARRNALRREKNAREFYSLENDENYVSFCNQMEVIGLKIKDIPGDGNCLFRSLSDQLEGDHSNHATHRQQTVQYMRVNKHDFEPFHLEEKPFLEYLEELGKDGTFAGNDAIVAFARNNNLDIIIHQYNSPRFVINGGGAKENKQLHIAYHNGEHYSSLRRIYDETDEPAYLAHLSSSQGNANNKTLQPAKFNKGRKQAKTNQQMNRVKPVKLVSPVTETREAVIQCSLPKESSDSSEISIKDSPGSVTTAFTSSTIEQDIIETTNCKDINLVRQTLADNGFDVDSTVAYLMQLLSLQEDLVEYECQKSEDNITSNKDKLSEENEKQCANEKKLCEESLQMLQENTNEMQEVSLEMSQQECEMSCSTLPNSSDNSGQTRGTAKKQPKHNTKFDPNTITNRQYAMHSQRVRKKVASKKSSRRFMKYQGGYFTDNKLKIFSQNFPRQEDDLQKLISKGIDITM
eukprot:gene5159-5811_t